MTNPLLWLELRVRIRERKLWIISLLYLVCLLGMSFIPLATVFQHDSNQSDNNPPVQPADVGTVMITTSLFTLLALLCIISPLSSAAAVSQEREQRTLAGLLNTPLSAARIAWGKLLGTWVFILWLIALSCPFLFLAVVWCGFSPWFIVGELGIIFAVGATTSTIALGLSGFFKRTITSYLGAGTIFFFWFFVFPLLGLMCSNLQSSGDQATREQFEKIQYYVFFSHHPAAPLIILFQRMIYDDESLPVDPTAAIITALAIWLVLGLIFFRIACRGLRGSLTEKG